MKVLALHQPWATLVACGAKRFETRNWSTRYRGPLAIHATKTTNLEALRTFRESPHCPSALETVHLPTGRIIAVATLVGVYPVEALEPREAERLFGDWSGGRFAWELEGVVRLNVPVPHRGRQGLYDLEGEDLQLVKRELGHSRAGLPL